jgi:hypothetical protein
VVAVQAFYNHVESDVGVNRVVVEQLGWMAH